MVQRTAIFALLGALVMIASADSPAQGAGAADAPSTAPTTRPLTIAVDGQRVNIVAFVRPDQPQSLEIIKEISKCLERASGADAPPAVTLVVSDHATGNIEAPWPIVRDPGYELSGEMNVHAWPTTLVLRPDGSEVAHLAGLNQSFAVELQAYIDLAAGRADEAEVKRALANPQVVTDSPEQMAARHRRVAEQHLAAGDFRAALTEIQTGLKIKPDDAQLRMLEARLWLAQGDSAQAAAALDHVADGAAAPPFQVQTLRARVLIAQEKWDEARTAAAEALKLNPKPAEAHYLQGKVFEHDQDWPRAAEQFRLAYESLEK